MGSRWSPGLGARFRRYDEHTTFATISTLTTIQAQGFGASYKNNRANHADASFY